MHNFAFKFNNKENIYFGINSGMHSARNSTKRVPYCLQNNRKINQAENLKLNINIVPNGKESIEENNYPNNLFQSYGPTGEIYNKNNIK